MNSKRTILLVSLLLLVLTLILSACGGGNAALPVDTGNGGGEVEATPDPQELFPETLVLHPDAFKIEVTPATHTYVYHVPMLVQEASDYLLEELGARGWEPAGQPTVMGHLATINMTREGARLNISLQDSERTETTRIQMLLLEQ